MGRKVKCRPGEPEHGKTGAAGLTWKVRSGAESELSRSPAGPEKGTRGVLIPRDV